MIPVRIDGATVCLGKPAGWDEKRHGKCTGLWVRIDGGVCHSAWEPTPEELAFLLAGGTVVLSVLGGQPPVQLTVLPPVIE